MTLRNKLMFVMVLISLIVLSINIYAGVPCPSIECTGDCSDAGDGQDNHNFWCKGADSCAEGDSANWKRCCCDVVGAETCKGIWDAGVALGAEAIDALCNGEEGSGEESTLTSPIDTIVRCTYTPAEATSNYSAVFAEVDSIKVNGEEQLLNGKKLTLKDSDEVYKHFSTVSFTCAKKPAPPESSIQVGIEVTGEAVATGSGDEEYCDVEINVPVLNENVQLLVLDSDFSSTPVVVAKEEQLLDKCLSPEKEDMYFDNKIKVSNGEEKLVNIYCDQKIMVKPVIKTDSQRWTEVCEKPAVGIIQEYKMGTTDGNIKTIFDWQRVDVDEWENAYLLNREKCEYQELFNSLVEEIIDEELTLEKAKNREDCAYVPQENGCYWFDARNGTVLKVKVSEATDDSYIEVSFRNCSCFCEPSLGIQCDYTADSCSAPEKLRDLECPDLMKSECVEGGDIAPDGLPSCGGRGGGFSSAEDTPPSGWYDLGVPYDTPVCYGPTPNYCARTCSVPRLKEMEETCYGTDYVMQHYWGKCSPEASCPAGFESPTGEQCTGAPGEGNCVYGCVLASSCEGNEISESSSSGSLSDDSNLPFSLDEVEWIDRDVSGWEVTSELRFEFSGSQIILDFDKTNDWPTTAVGEEGVIVNANAWIFAKYNGKWYAGTWEWMRPGQSSKNKENILGGADGNAIGGELNSWKPKQGEQVGFMVSSVARLGTTDVKERTNIVMTTWQ